MKQYSSVDDYINETSEPAQSLLRSLREAIKKAAPEANKKISYGIPTFYQNGNLVHFAAFKDQSVSFRLPMV